MFSDVVTHSFHGDVHVIGLVDGCPRCTEYAEAPWRSLDDEMVGALRFRIRLNLRPRSDNEARAMDNLLYDDAMRLKGMTDG